MLTNIIAKTGMALVMGAALSIPAFAQYTGPSDISSASVSSILEDPNDDQSVQLQGRLLRQISSDKYIFSDGDDEIIVEIDPELFLDVSIDETTNVEIVGEVDTSHRRPPEIEVDTIRVTK